MKTSFVRGWKAGDKHALGTVEVCPECGLLGVAVDHPLTGQKRFQFIHRIETRGTFVEVLRRCIIQEAAP